MTSPTMNIDLEQETVVLYSVAAAHEAASSELSSIERVPLSELTNDQIVTIATNGDLETVHRRSAEVGMMVMKFINYFERFKPIVVSMKEKLCGPRGSHRRTMISGREMNWSEYCKTYYGCSYRWVQKLLDGDYVSVRGEDAVDAVKSASDEGVNSDCKCESIPCTCITQTDEPKLSKKDLTIAALQKKNGELLEQVEKLVYKLNHPETPVITSVPDAILATAVAKHEAQVAAEPTYDPDFESFDFVLEHFQPITKPLSFASELDRLIRACDMQQHVKTVMIEEAQPATQEAL